MANLYQAHQQWANRPQDERFVSLTEMQRHFNTIRAQSRHVVASPRRLHAAPTSDHRGIQVVAPSGASYYPTHWAFSQLASLAAAPAGYLRTLPSTLAADCLNYGLQAERGAEEAAGFLLQSNGSATLRAATGPKYGRVWNADIVAGLTQRFGDGVTGDTFRVPGEFGKRVAVTRDNTTLFAGDRDMFVFLADEDHRIEIPNRRGGQPGSLARGFFVWNSEVGASTLGIGTFLFDFVCSNRIVWGASQYKEIRVRHDPSAPERWLDEVAPALSAYANANTAAITQTISAAQRHSFNSAYADTFLAERFGKRSVPLLQARHMSEEGRPIETLWDVATAATAWARDILHQDERVAIERKAGLVLDLAA